MDQEQENTAALFKNKIEIQITKYIRHEGPKFRNKNDKMAMKEAKKAKCRVVNPPPKSVNIDRKTRQKCKNERLLTKCFKRRPK